MGEGLIKKIEAEAGLLEKIELAVPGFSGYKNKELRREADRLVRDFLSRQIKQSKGNLRDVYGWLIERGARSSSGRVDGLIARLDRVSSEIDHASSGYSGFFDAVKVREEDLDAMLGFDLRLVELMKDLVSRTEAFRKIARDAPDKTIDEWVENLESTIRVVQDTFNGRSDVIKGVNLR